MSVIDLYTGQKFINNKSKTVYWIKNFRSDQEYVDLAWNSGGKDDRIRFKIRDILDNVTIKAWSCISKSRIKPTIIL